MSNCFERKNAGWAGGDKESTLELYLKPLNISVLFYHLV